MSKQIRDAQAARADAKAAARESREKKPEPRDSKVDTVVPGAAE
jgi:hypothetical protein